MEFRRLLSVLDRDADMSRDIITVVDTQQLNSFRDEYY